MRRIALEIAYDGTGYSGWQVQDNAKTVQETIEKTLSEIVKEKQRLKVAGRTDAGVHALGQVASFDTKSGMSNSEVYRAINSNLPADIRVLKVNDVSMDFHPRYSAQKRWYRYIIHRSQNPVPFFRNYSLWVMRDIEISLLSAYCEKLIGSHDFTSFATLEVDETPVRRVFECSFLRKNDFISLDIVANSFLRKMVRTIVGTFLELERKGERPERVTEILRARNRSKAGMTVYPGGLYLVKVFY
jgi:tRNA pseudouridine38-40 synthase